MPLKPGYSLETVRENIADLIRSGESQVAAVSAAMVKARQSYFQKFPHGALPIWMAYPKSARLAYQYKNGKPFPQTLMKNSSQRKSIKQAAKLFEDFTGEPANDPVEIAIPEMPKTALAIGKVLGIMYETVRDGVKESYQHKFKSSSRPLMVVSSDGKQVLMLGGAYTFTDRGIVDK